MSALYDRIDAAGRKIVGPTTKTSELLVGSRTFDIVDDDPQRLATAAGLDLDVYSLARMIASENGSSTAATILATAECARNKAAQRGVRVSALLLRSTIAGAGGKYGEQAAGRWASTRRDPNGRHVECARVAMEGSNAFAGAVDFFDPSAQDLGKQGRHPLRSSSEQYIAARAAEGLGWVGPLEDVDAYSLMVFSRQQKPIDIEPALAVLTEGRDRTSSKVEAVAVDLVGADIVDSFDDAGDVAADSLNLPGQGWGKAVIGLALVGGAVLLWELLT